MRLYSYNVNGIRAALAKGLASWISTEQPDVLCLQEIKAQENQIDTSLFDDLGYYHHWHPAQKKGYSGVAILSKKKPLNVFRGAAFDPTDAEGRIMRADFDDFSIVSLYLPSGTNPDRLDFKLAFMEDFLVYVNQLKKEIPNLIISGDYNICHQAIDIHDPIRNANVSGFLPVERQWLTRFIDSGFVDSFRMLHPKKQQYSWWSYRAQSRKNNKGWRIDYHMLNGDLQSKITQADTLTQVMFSDHCPITLGLSL